MLGVGVLFMVVAFIWLIMSQLIGFHRSSRCIMSLEMIDPDENSFENGRKIGVYAWQHCPLLIYKLILAGLTFRPKVTGNTISKNMHDEIVGFVSGFNEGSLIHITYEQVLNYHKLADSKCGCTCRVVRKGILERNMDWLPFGTAGTDTILLKYQYKNANRKKWYSLTIPGFFGVATAFKGDFAFAMNVSPGKLTQGGELASSMNRSIMENYNSARGIKRFLLSTHPKTYSQYHVTIVSPKMQFCYSFGSLGSPPTFRNEFPLYTVNFQEPERVNHSFSSPERLSYLESEDAKKEKLLHERRFNTMLTIHNVYCDTKMGLAAIRVDNGFAADSESTFTIDFR